MPHAGIDLCIEYWRDTVIPEELDAMFNINAILKEEERKHEIFSDEK